MSQIDQILDKTNKIENGNGECDKKNNLTKEQKTAGGHQILQYREKILHP